MPAQLRNLIERTAALRHHQFGVLQKRKPEVGERHALAAAHQQGRLEFGLELLDRRGQRRLRQVHFLGRRADAAQLFNEHQRLHGREFHGYQ